MPEKNKRLNGKTEMPPPAKFKKHERGTLELDIDSAPPSIDILNSASIFRRQIKFTRLCLRGDVVQAEFSTGKIAEWLSATDLRTFARSQDIIFKATNYLMPTPSRRACTEVWEPVAQLIRRIASQDAIDMPNTLKDEFFSIIRSTWIKAGCPTARTPEVFTSILQECQTRGRDPKAKTPFRSCVWLGAEGEMAPDYTWVYQEALIDWLSTPAAKNKEYAWGIVRDALVMLGFRPDRPHPNKELQVRVWRGPKAVLIDNDAEIEPVIC